MPNSNTFAPAAVESSTIRERFARICAMGKARKPSFPPSSRITIAGWCSISARGSRASPPAVVSPLTLALTTW